jgi:hypothetical protein
MQGPDAGPMDVFSGAMATAITRNIKKIEVIEDATFTTLDFMFPSGEAQAADPTDPTYPALTKLFDIKQFRLATGMVLATFYG